MSEINFLKDYFNSLKNLLNHERYIDDLILVKDVLKKVHSEGKKTMIFGNGGSAADAQHFSTELTVRLKSNRKALPSISLVTDTSAISAIGNDFGFDFVFSRQIEALAQKGDLIIPITTSGNSLNIINALKYCKKKKFQTFGILGNKGGKSKKYCSDDFIVSSDNPSRIQEIHIIFWQTVCEIVSAVCLM